MRSCEQCGESPARVLYEDRRFCSTHCVKAWGFYQGHVLEGAYDDDDAPDPLEEYETE